MRSFDEELALVVSRVVECFTSSMAVVEVTVRLAREVGLA